MRRTEHFKRHLSIVTWRQDNGGQVEKVSEVAVEDPFHRTKVVLGWTFWEWLRILFTRREVEVVVHVRSDGVSRGRWFQGADICEKCLRNRVDNRFQHGDEWWCHECHHGLTLPPVVSGLDGRPATLTEAVELARGGPAPTPRQEYA